MLLINVKDEFTAFQMLANLIRDGSLIRELLTMNITIINGNAEKVKKYLRENHQELF